MPEGAVGSAKLGAHRKCDTPPSQTHALARAERISSLIDVRIRSDSAVLASVEAVDGCHSLGGEFEVVDGDVLEHALAWVQPLERWGLHPKVTSGRPRAAAVNGVDAVEVLNRSSALHVPTPRAPR
jgi:hypothetical protein